MKGRGVVGGEHVEDWIQVMFRKKFFQHSCHKLLVEFFAEVVRDPIRLADEFDAGGLVVEIGHFHDVVKLIAIQSPAGSDDDRVGLSLFELMRQKNIAVLSKEFKIVRGDCQHAAVVSRQREGDKGLGGEQPFRLDGYLWEQILQFPRIRFGRAICPAGDEGKVLPDGGIVGWGNFGKGARTGFIGELIIINWRLIGRSDGSISEVF